MQNHVVNSAGGNRSSKPILSAMPRKWARANLLFPLLLDSQAVQEKHQGLEQVGYH